MKKLIFLSLLILGQNLFAKLDVIVSILPQKTFVEAIGGEKVNVTLMVLPGNSPHTYEPKPSQMKDIAKAKLYFAIDVEFEDIWLSKFKSLNNTLTIIDLDEGVMKFPVEKDHDEHEKDDDYENHKYKKINKHSHKGLDPHIWTSPNNVKIIAKNIYNALVSYDNQNSAYYKSNYEKFLKHIEQTDTKITDILSDLKKDTKFMVFHPAWGYFAQQYHLTQLAIEAGGKNPKPRQVAHLIEEAKEEGVKAVFTAPEFSQKVAHQIAKEVNVPVIKVSPLNPKWSQNLIRLAKAIAHKK